MVQKQWGWTRLQARTCSLSGCDRSHHAKGLCRIHYRRRAAGAAPDKPLRGSSVIRDSDGRKLCWKCEEWLPVERFAKTSIGSDGLDTRCHRCRTLGRHGLTKKAFAELLEAQGGKCANPGCGATEPGGRAEWHVDHDHSHCNKKWSCGECIRGLLCQRCNIGLGLLGDSRERVAGMLVYMDNPPAQNLTMYGSTTNRGETQ